MTTGNHHQLMRMQQLSIAYRDKTVLHNVDFTINQGEIWFIIGPNGSGKSTLLRGLLGHLVPQQGTIIRHSEHCKSSNIGFVQQQIQLNQNIKTTVREFVSLGLVGVDKQESRVTEAKFKSALQQVGIENLAEHSFWTLSAGQQQRCALARAFIRNPQILILDEPTNGLDLRASYSFIETVIQHCSVEHNTLLFVTHQPELAAEYATHVALVYGGQVYAGKKQDILTAERLEQAYEVPIDIIKRSDGSFFVTVRAHNNVE